MAANVNMKYKNRTKKKEGELDESTGIKPVPVSPTAALLVCWIVQSGREYGFIVIGWVLPRKIMKTVLNLILTCTELAVSLLAVLAFS